MRIGIDLDGTKIEVIALSNDGQELFRKRVDTPRHDYQKTLQAIADLVADAELATGERGRDTWNTLSFYGQSKKCPFSLAEWAICR